MEVQVTDEVRRFLAVNTGDGSGDGSGYGYGYGSGYGSGSGLRALDGQHVHLIAGVQTAIASITGNYAR